MPSENGCLQFSFCPFPPLFLNIAFPCCMLRIHRTFVLPGVYQQYPVEKTNFPFPFLPFYSTGLEQELQTISQQNKNTEGTQHILCTFRGFSLSCTKYIGNFYGFFRDSYSQISMQAWLPDSLPTDMNLHFQQKQLLSGNPVIIDQTAL